MPGFFNFGKRVGLDIRPKNKINTKSKIVSTNEDGATIVEAITPFANYYSWNSDFRFSDEIELIKKFRDMSLNVYCDRIINEIVNECISNDDETGTSVSTDLDKTTFTEDIKEKIIKEFNNILKLLNFNNNGQNIFREFYIDGRIYYQKIIDKEHPENGIIELRKIDSLDIKKIKQIVRKLDKDTGAFIIDKEEEFYQYTPYYEYGNGGFTAQNLLFNPDAIAYASSGLYLYKEQPVNSSQNRNNITLGNRYIVSFLYPMIKPLNQLNIIEEASIISQVSRAPQRRIHYVDISGMAPTKGEKALKDYAAAIKNDLQYNSDTGDYNNASHTYSMQEDLIIPRRNGTNTAAIETLPGNSGNEDVKVPEYFKMKVYMASHVPLSRMDANATSFLGRASEINRDELNFSKFCNNLRENFSELFKDLLKTQLLLKRIVSYRDWQENKNLIRFIYSSDTYISQLRNIEMIQEKISALRDSENYVGKYFSKRYIQKNILDFDDEQIEQLNDEMKREAKDEPAVQLPNLSQNL